MVVCIHDAGEAGNAGEAPTSANECLLPAGHGTTFHMASAPHTSYSLPRRTSSVLPVYLGPIHGVHHTSLLLYGTGRGWRVYIGTSTKLADIFLTSLRIGLSVEDTHQFSRSLTANDYKP